MTQLPIFPLKEHKFTPRAIRRHNLGLCCTPRCKNTYGKGRWFCPTCIEREYRWRDPVKAIFRDAKQRAKKRKIGWHISLKAFRKFIAEHVGIIEKRGDFADAWCLDRKRGDRAYTIKNLQVLTRRINTYKEMYRRIYGPAREAEAFEQFTTEQLVGDLETIRKALPLHEPITEVPHWVNE